MVDLFGFGRRGGFGRAIYLVWLCCSKEVCLVELHQNVFQSGKGGEKTFPRETIECVYFLKRARIPAYIAPNYGRADIRFLGAAADFSVLLSARAVKYMKKLGYPVQYHRGTYQKKIFS